MPPNHEPTWRWAAEPLSERIIRNAERALGVEFPADYRACVRDNPGGAPEPDRFLVPVASDRSETHSVGLLLSLDPQESENVVQTLRELAEEGRWPEGLIPIINDGSGNFVCLDYRADPSRKTPTIAYRSCELGDGDGLVPLAASFSEFLAALRAET